MIEIPLIDRHSYTLSNFEGGFYKSPEFVALL